MGELSPLIKKKEGKVYLHIIFGLETELHRFPMAGESVCPRVP